MLGKLFKYEFKNTAKVMLTIYGVLLFTTILASVSFFYHTRGGQRDASAASLAFDRRSYDLVYFLCFCAVYRILRLSVHSLLQDHVF